MSNVRIRYKYLVEFPQHVNFDNGVINRSSETDDLEYALLKAEAYRSIVDTEHHDKVKIKIMASIIANSDWEDYDGTQDLPILKKD